ncbi:MAG TPA: DUF5658 family protein [Chloroflexota bacterium]
MQTSLYTTRRIVLCAFVGFNLLDAFSTFTALRKGFQEGNAVPALIISAMGEEGIYVLKATTVWLVVAIMLKLTHYWPRLWYALHLGTAVTALAVIWNLAVMTY